MWECSKKILVSLNNSDSPGIHVGRIVSRLSARAEGENCGAMLLEEEVEFAGVTALSFQVGPG